MKKLLVIAISLMLFTGTGCGGGGGGDGDSSGDLVLEGTLIQGSGGSHERLGVKHSEGEPIGSVEICALGTCSTTDESGRWGFLVESGFSGGEILLTVVGHGIDTGVVVSVPAGANEAVLELINSGGVVTAHSVVIDGTEQTL